MSPEPTAANGPLSPGDAKRRTFHDMIFSGKLCGPAGGPNSSVGNLVRSPSSRKGYAIARAARYSGIALAAPALLDHDELVRVG